MDYKEDAPPFANHRSRNGHHFLATMRAADEARLVAQQEQSIRKSRGLGRSWKFYFYSHEPNEPPPVPMDRDNLSAEFWLLPVSLAPNLGFSARELRYIREIVEQNQQDVVEAWNDDFGSRHL